MTKRLTVTILAAIIIFTWGFAFYHYLFPESASMSAEDQATIKFVVVNQCPHQIELYNQLLQDDGTILVQDAEHLILNCTQQMRADLFYEALVQEFSRHYE